MRKTESQKIALCGVLGALSVVLLLVGAALQIGTYAAPMLAAFLLIPVLDEYGPKYALLLYATVSVLSVLLVPELELAFFYVFVIGYYPVLRQQLARIKSTLLRWVVKFAVFNGATVLVYLLLFALLGPAILDELLADGVGMLAALLAAGNLSFWLCDRAVAEPEGEVAGGQQGGQHANTVGQQLVQDGRAEQRKEQQVNQHRGPVEHRELNDPTQQRTFYACQLLAQHRIIADDEHVKKRQLQLRHQQHGQNRHSSVQKQGVLGAVLVQHGDEQERGQHRRGVGADLQRRAHQQ